MSRGGAQRRGPSVPHSPSVAPPNVESEPRPADTQRSAEVQRSPPQLEASAPKRLPVYCVAKGRALTGGARGMLEAGARVTVADCGNCPERLRKLCEAGYIEPGGAE